MAKLAVIDTSAYAFYVTGLSFSPDGSQLLFATQDADGECSHTSHVWDISTQTELPVEPEDAQEPVEPDAISPDGRILVFADAQGIRLLDAADGTELTRLRGHNGGGATRIVFSADGTARMSVLDRGGGVTSVAFSPDGTRLISVGNDSTVRLWGIP